MLPARGPGSGSRLNASRSGRGGYASPPGERREEPRTFLRRDPEPRSSSARGRGLALRGARSRAAGAGAREGIPVLTGPVRGWTRSRGRAVLARG